MENLAKALVKAQSKLRNLGKNADGFNYSYLTLDKLIDETRGPLAENGLVIVQPMDTTDDGRPVINTFLLHESGEMITGRYPLSAVTMKQCNGAQQMGAAISYARRYCLAAMLNIAQADDDGQCIKAEVKIQTPEKPAQQHTKADAEKLLVDHQEVLDEAQKTWAAKQIAAENYDGTVAGITKVLAKLEEEKAQNESS